MAPLTPDTLLSPDTLLDPNGLYSSLQTAPAVLDVILAYARMTSVTIPWRVTNTTTPAQRTTSVA